MNAMNCIGASAHSNPLQSIIHPGFADVMFTESYWLCEPTIDSLLAACVVLYVP